MSDRTGSSPILFDDAHLTTALMYTDLNPARAGLAAQAWDWSWSTTQSHIGEKGHDPVLDFEWVGCCCDWYLRAWTVEACTSCDGRRITRMFVDRERGVRQKNASVPSSPPDWEVPHLNIGNTGKVHLEVPAGYDNAAVPKGSAIGPGK